jgi:hypothetical protein
MTVYIDNPKICLGAAERHGSGLTLEALCDFTSTEVYLITKPRGPIASPIPYEVVLSQGEENSRARRRRGC